LALVLGALRDQPPLELRERGEHVAIASPIGVEISMATSSATSA
jgi:hypothetical protein